MFKNKKIIGVTTIKRLPPFANVNSQIPYYKIAARLISLITQQGYIPLPLTYEDTTADTFLDLVDGLILAGGLDVHPSFYHQEDQCQKLHTKYHCMDFKKTQLQLELLEKILHKNQKEIPILCICAGMQILNIACGGDLAQDIPSMVPFACNHNPIHPDSLMTVHKVKVLTHDSLLYNIVHRDQFAVSSHHHQCVNYVPKILKVTAQAPDGVIEAIEYTANPHIFCLGTQWHVEAQTSPEDTLITDAFFQHC